MNLRDARLGQPERLGYLAQTQIFKIVKGHDLLLNFWQLLDALRNQLL